MPVKSKLEEAMALQLRAAKLPTPVRELSFMPGRKFRMEQAVKLLDLHLDHCPELHSMEALGW